jgi:hypothetical protein
MTMPKGIDIHTHRSSEEPELFMTIDRHSLDNILLSIAHRRLSDRGSGRENCSGDNFHWRLWR